MNVHTRRTPEIRRARWINARHTRGKRCVFVDELSHYSRGMAVISDKFVERSNFSHTCGVLDGKHVNGKCPPNSGSLYHYNYKGFYSVVLMALLDAHYKFIWADIGGMGSASDAQIYNASKLKECVEDGSLGFPDPEPLHNGNQDVPYFRCLRHTTDMIKPYSLLGMTRPERILN